MERVLINASGRYFETRKETFLKYPETMLGKMFASENEEMLKPCEDGSFFFDIDGKLFRNILNFYRGNTLTCPEDFDENFFLATMKYFLLEKYIKNTVNNVRMSENNKRIIDIRSKNKDVFLTIYPDKDTNVMLYNNEISASFEDIKIVLEELTKDIGMVEKLSICYHVDELDKIEMNFLLDILYQFTKYSKIECFSWLSRREHRYLPNILSPCDEPLNKKLHDIVVNILENPFITYAFLPFVSAPSYDLYRLQNIYKQQLSMRDVQGIKIEKIIK